MEPRMNADERRYEDLSGHDLDIWGDGSRTNATPIPEEWERQRRENDEIY